MYILYISKIYNIYYIFSSSKERSNNKRVTEL